MKPWDVYQQKEPVHSRGEYWPNVQRVCIVAADTAHEAIEIAKRRGIAAPMVEEAK